MKTILTFLLAFSAHMKPLAQQFLTLALVLSLAVPVRAVAGKETHAAASKLATCGLYLLFGSAFIGYGASGGTVGVALSHQRVFFESTSDYEARLARERREQAPVVIAAASGMGIGLILLIVAGVSYLVGESSLKREQTNRPKLAEVEITDLPPGSRVVFAGTEIPIVDGRASLVRGTRESQVSMSIEIHIEGEDSLTLVLPAKAGERASLSLAALQTARGSE